jgi:hypothetical protein
MEVNNYRLLKEAYVRDINSAVSMMVYKYRYCDQQSLHFLVMLFITEYLIIKLKGNLRHHPLDVLN